MSTTNTSSWLLGFDFDGTLANPTDGHSVDPRFFSAIPQIKSRQNVHWGICTGRSLEFILEGIRNAKFPFMPDFLVTKERELFYLNENTTDPEPDLDWNQRSISRVQEIIESNARTIESVKRFITEQTTGQWIEHPEDPAGIIATSADEIDRAVDIIESCPHRCKLLDYQRNSIYLRFSHRDFSKGTALQHLQKKYTITTEHTLTMGDNYNDLSMLNETVARHFGSPSNGIPSLKKHLSTNGGFIMDSSYATGVVEALEQYL